MPTNIAMKPGFLYLGTTQAQAEGASAYVVPYADSIPFTTTYRAQFNTTAAGSIVGQQLGRGIASQQATWSVMDSTTWWALNSWIETNGMCFWVRFFDFNAGAWRTRQFYVEEIVAEPCRPGGVAGAAANRGKPLYYRNATLTLVDLGR